MKRIFLFLALVLAVVVFVASCGTEQKEQKSTEKPVSMVEADISRGFNLLETNCFNCHSPKGSHDARIAPPMVAIKNHYIDEETTEAEFTEALIAFVQNPTEENTKMKGAVRKFGVMPKMEFSEKDLRDIAAYIYRTELEAPEWFEEHYQREKKRHRKRLRGGEIDYLEQGKSFAMQTKAQLGKNLMAAIQSDGPAGAVEFCNIRAYPLTDSMATALNAEIKRVTDQPRNPDNQANEEELNYIRTAKSLLSEGMAVEPVVKDRGASVTGYYPITTNAMCLKCHGQPEKDINQATLDVLAALYPNDKAKGYGLNELRGIWVVEMEKQRAGKGEN